VTPGKIIQSKDLKDQYAEDYIILLQTNFLRHRDIMGTSSKAYGSFLQVGLF
jgi:hypothetical protein